MMEMEDKQEKELPFVSFQELPRTYKKVPIDRTIDKLTKCGVSFYVRLGTECNELIYDNSHRVFSTANKNFPSSHIFLFSLVKKDVDKYLKANPVPDLPPFKQVTHFNYDYDHDHGTITGTDLNHAYWRIAFIKGYISQKTYNHGLNDKAKALRLATLSVLGRQKVFDFYDEGKFVEKVLGKRKDESHQDIYKDIRYSCYYMMYQLSIILGEDFDCWKTDCIYYRDTPFNRKIVHDFFNERQMLFKQLVFSSMAKFKMVDDSK